MKLSIPVTKTRKACRLSSGLSDVEGPAEGPILVRTRLFIPGSEASFL